MTRGKAFWFCTECDLRIPVDAPAPAAATVEAVPFPVAFPLHFAREVSLPPTDRLTNAIFAAYQAMRLTGLVLLADYLASDDASYLTGQVIHVNGGALLP